MKDMLDKILQIEKNYNELGLLLSDPATAQDYNKLQYLIIQWAMIIIAHFILKIC